MVEGISHIHAMSRFLSVFLLKLFTWNWFPITLHKHLSEHLSALHLAGEHRNGYIVIAELTLRALNVTVNIRTGISLCRNKKITSSWSNYVAFLFPVPHFRGLWETGVKSVKHHLKRILGDKTPSHEELEILLCKIEAARDLSGRWWITLMTSMSLPGHFLAVV